MNNKAFTLIELIIVIAIIGVIASSIIIAINPTERLGKAKDAQRLTEAEGIEEAIERYTADNGELPPSIASKEEYIPYIITITTNGNSLSCVEVLGDVDEVNINTELEDYLPSLPIDPDINDEPTYGTGYYLRKVGNNVTVTPCDLYANRDIPSDGLVLAMRMDEDPSSNSCSGGEDVCDYSGEDNHGTSSGSMTSDDIVVGKVGGAIDFDGVDDYLFTDVISSLIIGDFTILMWMKDDSDVNGYWQGIGIDYSNADGVRIARHRFIISGNDKSFSPKVDRNVWGHYALVHDSDIKTFYGYTDNNVPVSTTYTGTLSGDNKIYIGASTSYKLNGSVDEVIVYDRVLTTDEISDIYNLQK